MSKPHTFTAIDLKTGLPKKNLASKEVYTVTASDRFVFKQDDGAFPKTLQLIRNGNDLIVYQDGIVGYQLNDFFIHPDATVVVDTSYGAQPIGAADILTTPTPPGLGMGPMLGGIAALGLVGGVINNTDNSTTETALNYVGTPQDDVQQGTSLNDTLAGNGGDDDLSGGLGQDTITGGAGSDALTGGAGNDLIDGGDDDDYVDAGEGDDTVLGGNDDDQIMGGTGSDSVFGQDGNDDIDGGFGADYIDGGAGSDQLMGGFGKDTIVGGAGDDSVDGGAGDDTIDGEQGSDTLRAGSGNDTVVDTQGDNWLYGDDGNDSLSAGAGTDVLLGGEGNDTVYAGDGEDYLSGGNGQDSLYGEAGEDYIGDFAYKSKILLDEALVAPYTNDNDLMVGGDGNDYFESFFGADTILAGAGDDGIEMYSNLFGSVSDTASILGGDGNDTINITILMDSLHQFTYTPIIGYTVANGGADDDSYNISTVGPVTIADDAGNDTLTANNYSVLNLDLGVGDDSYTYNAQDNAAQLNLTDVSGNDTLNMILESNTIMDTSIDLGIGNDRLSLDGYDPNVVDHATTVINGGAGHDALAWIKGDLDLTTFSGQIGSFEEIVAIEQAQTLYIDDAFIYNLNADHTVLITSEIVQNSLRVHDLLSSGYTLVADGDYDVFGVSNAITVSSGSAVYNGDTYWVYQDDTYAGLLLINQTTVTIFS